mgnify:CR=1 FL=1
MAETIEVKVEKDHKELIIRKGEAPEAVNPIALNVEGRITAPGDFVKTRKNIDKKCALVTVSRDDLSIKLRTEENSKFGTTIFGKLSFDKFFTSEIFV